MLKPETLEKLKAAAREAMTRAHVPMSGFPVGAAVLTGTGAIYAGCNTESVIAGLGTCAERSAVDHAVVHGEKSFIAVMVVSTREEPLFPCGVCRQYLFEFAQLSGLDTMVYALGAKGLLESRPLSRLIESGLGPLDIASQGKNCAGIPPTAGS